MIRGHAARIRAHAVLADPTFLTDTQLEIEVRGLLEAERKAGYRWWCTRTPCDGMPHAGMGHRHARSEQRPPAGDWLTWAIIAGRGYGKTRTGAETTKEWGMAAPLHVAVIGENLIKVRDLCFEHPKSGLLAVIPPEMIKRYHKGLGDTDLTLTNGTVFRGLSAEQPDRPRGYAFDVAWYDEFGAWKRSAGEVHSNVMFALRESADPRIVITTTPKPLPHIRALVKAGQSGKGRVRLTRGHMRDNKANLSQVMLDELEDVYGGTRLGRQELAGELLDDVEGALWALWMFEVGGFRIAAEDAHSLELDRVVVSIDPATTSSATSDSSGLCVAGRGHQSGLPRLDARPRGFVLHSSSVRMTPEKTMREAAKLYHLHDADCVVIEANNGGDYLPAVLQAVDPSVPWVTVHATRGKYTRAEPVAALYERGRVSHVGAVLGFAELEDQMTSWTPGDGAESPDATDALVWALTDLLVQQAPTVNGKVRDRRFAGRR